jgi:hypothetical protein
LRRKLVEFKGKIWASEAVIANLDFAQEIEVTPFLEG